MKLNSTNSVSLSGRTSSSFGSGGLGGVDSRVTGSGASSGFSSSFLPSSFCLSLSSSFLSFSSPFFSSPSFFSSGLPGSGRDRGGPERDFIRSSISGVTFTPGGTWIVLPSGVVMVCIWTAWAGRLRTSRTPATATTPHSASNFFATHMMVPPALLFAGHVSRPPIAHPPAYYYPNIGPQRNRIRVDSARDPKAGVAHPPKWCTRDFESDGPIAWHRIVRSSVALERCCV